MVQVRRTVRALIIGSLTVGLLAACVPSGTPPDNGGGTVSPAPATPSATPTASPVPTPLPPDCAVNWDTGAKVDSTATSAAIVDVRVGRHDCFDRLVIDLDGNAGGFDVRYVPAVVEEGRGEVLTLRGSAFMQVLVIAPAYDPVTGAGTYSFSDPAELADVSGFTTFRQVAWGGSFEGQTMLGLGLGAERPFRVFTLAGPGDGARLVIDVAG